MNRTMTGNDAMQWLMATLNRGVSAQTTGDLDGAERSYREVLHQFPQQPDALHLLGVVHCRRGDHADGIAAIRAAIRNNGRIAGYHMNLGNALRDAGDAAGAIAAYRRALELQADNPDVYFNLGAMLRRLGRGDEARQALERAVQLRADPAYLEMLGEVLFETGDPGRAGAIYLGLAALQPGNAGAHFSLGRARLILGQMAEAAACFMQAVELDPAHALAHYELGLIQSRALRHAEALASYGRALAARPDFVEAQINFGNALLELGRLDEAEQAYRRTLELRPDYAEAWNNLGLVLKQRGRVSESFAACDRAVALAPQFAAAWNHRGGCHFDSGDVAAARADFAQAFKLDPTLLVARWNVVSAGNYVEGEDPARIFREHLDYACDYIPLAADPVAHGNDRDPERRLRIGYISPDFRRHSVAHFIEPVLARHDPDGFEVTGYYNFPHDDDVTERLRGHCRGGWVRTVGLDDAALAERIRADGIDILVDLAGHTAGGRALALARRPAPVQAVWLGYLATTGLAAIGHRLTDALVDPPGYEAHAIERPLRLPGCYVCYRPDPEAPAVGPLPAAATGHITFGSFNNLPKLSPATVALWARVLHAVPGSRLVLKTASLADAGIRDKVLARFAAHGIDAERLELRGRESGQAMHLALYNRIDIALDTWPYNGVTTTCEALWMGVPVVSRHGPTHASRQGLTLLGAVGLGQCAQGDDDNFVRACADLAGDRDGLADLRAGLRDRLAASPLLDETAFTRRLESAYRQIWRDWCTAAV